MIARILALWISLVIVLPSVSPSQEWVARYDGPSNSMDVALAITVDAFGNVYVTGLSEGLGTYDDYATVKYDSSGAEQWVARYNDGWDVAHAIAVDAFGNVYVTGDGHGDYTTVKYDSSGVEQWVARYNGPGNDIDRAYAIAIDTFDNIYVTGESEGSGTSTDYTTVKYNSSGIEQWVARYNGPGNRNDVAYAIAIDSAGNVYVTGGSSGLDIYRDYTTVKYDSSGVEQWVARYNGPSNRNDNAYAIAIDNAGNVYITGASPGSGTSADYTTVKYDSSGMEQWVARYNGQADLSDVARAIALDDFGNVYITGESYGSYWDYATVKYDSLGVEKWVARYNNLNNYLDKAHAIAVDAFGNVYVTGESVGSNTSMDYATVKYDSLGVEQGVARYNGPGNGWDVARAIALDDFGNVYVTGGSEASFANDDYATIKYSCVGVAEEEMRAEKQETGLEIYHNPFRNNVNIKWRTADVDNIKLTIYNTVGRVVKHLINYQSQFNSAVWDATDDAGHFVPSGVYFVKFKAGDYSATEKLLLIR